MGGFTRVYEQQYAVALFNNVRFDIEGGGGPQPQLLHRKVKYPVTVPKEAKFWVKPKAPNMVLNTLKA